MTHVLSRCYFLFGTFLWFLCMAGFSYAVGADEPRDKAKVNINVGIYAPFSSEQAFIGRHILGGMETASDQLKSSNINYSFYTLDQFSNRRTALKKIQKFINTHQINVLLTRGAANGLLIAPLAKRNNIVHFSMATDPTIADGRNNFLVWSPAYEEALALINEHKRQSEYLRSTKTAEYPQINKNLSNQLQANAPMADMLQIIHKSAIMARNENSEFCNQELSNQVHAQVLSAGSIGPFNFAKNGVLYTRSVAKVERKHQEKTV